MFSLPISNPITMNSERILINVNDHNQYGYSSSKLCLDPNEN